MINDPNLQVGKRFVRFTGSLLAENLSFKNLKETQIIGLYLKILKREKKNAIKNNLQQFFNISLLSFYRRSRKKLIRRKNH